MRCYRAGTDQRGREYESPDTDCGKVAGNQYGVGSEVDQRKWAEDFFNRRLTVSGGEECTVLKGGEDGERYRW